MFAGVIEIWSSYISAWTERKPPDSTPAVEVKPALCPSFPSLSLHLPVRNCFRVSSRGRSKAHPYSLQANDSFSKQQWITCLRQAIVHSRDKMAHTSQSQLSCHPDPALYHIADLSLSSNSEMADHTGRWLFGWSCGGLYSGACTDVYIDIGGKCDRRFRLDPYKFLHGKYSFHFLMDCVIMVMHTELLGNSVIECELWM